MITISLVPAISANAAIKSNWRDLSRNARLARDNAEYERAMSGYSKALEKAREENATIDQLCDLQLLMVDTCRRQGKYSDGRVILSKVDPIIKSRQYFDAMLPVRFLRRRAELELADGDKYKALQLYNQMLSIQERHFHKESPVIINATTIVLNLAIALKDWDTIQGVLTRWQSQIFARQLPQELQEPIRIAFLTLFQDSLIASRSGNIDTASALLRMSANLSPPVEQQLKSWASFLHRCIVSNNESKTAEASATLIRLLQEVHGRTDTQEIIKAQLEAYNALARYYKIKNQFDLRLASLTKYRQLAALLKNPKQPEILTLQKAELELVILYQQQNRPEKEIRLLLDHAFALTKRLNRSDDNTQSIMALAQAYLRRKQFEKAEEVFKSINPKLSHKDPDTVLLTARTHAFFARQYIDAGLYEKSREHVSAAKQLFASEQQNRRYDKTFERLNRLESTINELDKKGKSEEK